VSQPTQTLDATSIRYLQQLSGWRIASQKSSHPRVQSNYPRFRGGLVFTTLGPRFLAFEDYTQMKGTFTSVVDELSVSLRIEAVDTWWLCCLKFFQ
jgi:hypothetical protein